MDGCCGHRVPRLSTGDVQTRPGREKTQPGRPYPQKTGTLGLAPVIFSKVDAPKTHEQVSLATPKIFIGSERKATK